MLKRISVLFAWRLLIARNLIVSRQPASTRITLTALASWKGLSVLCAGEKKEKEMCVRAY